MIELAKHIEVLLLENDCVIVPGLGGFIAHHHSSVYHRETGEFLPPMRSIGFNPQLTMNDGLLVQSYMQAYNTDFPDATRKIETIVEQLKDDLYQKGQVSLNRLGTLYFNMHGGYEFEPANDSFFTPSLYGLGKITLKKLGKLNDSEGMEPMVKPIKEKVIAMPVRPQNPSHTIQRSGWIRNMVAAAVAIIMFFLMSAPVENTYVDHMGYASLGGASIFDAIRKESVVSFLSEDAQQQEVKRIKSNVNTLKPVKVKTEKIEVPASQSDTMGIPEKAMVKDSPQQSPMPSQSVVQNNIPTPVKESVTSEGGKYFIIAASLQTQEDAEKELRKFKAKGYTHAQIIKSDERYRIAIAQFDKKENAQKKMQALKTEHAELKSAWVFTSK